MKMLYNFEIMDIGEEFFAVPVGDDRSRFHGMIRLNQDAAEMFRLIQEYRSPEAVLDALLQSHPDLERNDIDQALCDFLNQLIAEGILDPKG